MANDIIKIAKDALDQAIQTEKRNKKLLESIGPAVVDALGPVLTELKDAVSKLKVDVAPIVQVNPEIKIPPIELPNINIPDVIVPDIHVPTPQVNYTPPAINIPDIVMPDEMDIKGWIGIMGYDRGLLSNPLPVQLRDAKGNPVLLGGGAVIGGGGSGGMVTINGATATVGVVTINPDGNPIYSLGSSGAGSSSVSLVNADGTYYNSDNPLPITGTLSTTPGATFFASDAILSDNVIQNVGNATPVGTGYQDNALRVVHATDAIVSVRVDGSSASLAANIVDSSGVAFSGSNPVPTYQASQPTTFDVKQVSGSTDSVNLLQINGTAPATGLNETNAGVLRTVLMTDSVVSVNVVSDAITLSDTTDTIGALQVSGAVDSVNILQIAGTAVDTNTGASSAGSIRTILASNSNLSTQTTTDAIPNNDLPAHMSMMMGINGTNGTWDRAKLATLGGGYQDQALRVTHATDAIASVRVDGSSASLAANIVDSSGIAYSGSNPVPITWVSGSPTTVGSSIVDSSGVQYSGSNPMPITGNVNVNGSLNSVITVGPVVSDAVDDNSAPVQQGGIARTANPTAVAAGDVVKSTFDDLGRQITRPFQVRDLTQTAYVSVSTGTETTLLAAGGAGVFHDLVQIIGTNNSTAAIQVDIRAVTAGNVITTLYIPATSTAGATFTLPLPQDNVNNNWTVDLPDVTGTTVTVSALFIKEA